jgi:hypothetical protein
MDDEWLATLSSKDYLFPLQWAAVTWIVNVAYVPIIWLVYRYRRDRGLLTANERALVAGCLALVAFFVATLPFNAARLALAIQLQPARIFWMLDFLATIYLIWAAAEGATATPARASRVAAIVIAIALARGAYIMLVQFPDRQLVQAGLSDGDWGRAMAWARSSDVRSGWLADPAHAARFGTSVRVAGQRDVYVEAIKDAAVGMYDRNVAMRTRDRVAALGDFRTLTPDHARALAQTYDLDYLLSEEAIDLPVAFASGQIKIYRLR